MSILYKYFICEFQVHYNINIMLLFINVIVFFLLINENPIFISYQRM